MGPANQVVGNHMIAQVSIWATLCARSSAASIKFSDHGSPQKRLAAGREHLAPLSRIILLPPLN